MSEEEVDFDDEIRVSEQTELGQVMENLDSDKVDDKTGLSTVDFNTRIKGYERGAILINDELQRLGIFTFLNSSPKPSANTSSLTRPFKRLSISLDGKGRDEKVQLTQNQREHVSGGSFGERLKGLFTPQR